MCDIAGGRSVRRLCRRLSSIIVLPFLFLLLLSDLPKELNGVFFLEKGRRLVQVTPVFQCVFSLGFTASEKKTLVGTDWQFI